MSDHIPIGGEIKDRVPKYPFVLERPNSGLLKYNVSLKSGDIVKENYNDDKYETYVSHSGARLMIFQTPSERFRANVLVNIGSDSETGEDEVECAHILEHMVAALCTKNVKNATQVAINLDSRGIITNAETTDGYVSYFVSGPAICDVNSRKVDNAKYMTDVMMQIMEGNIIFPDDQGIKSELQAVEQELASAAGDEQGSSEREISNILYKGTTRAHSESYRLRWLRKKLETEQGIASLSKTLKKLYREWYQPRNLCLILVGKKLPDEFLRAVIQRVGKLKNIKSRRTTEKQPICNRDHLYSKIINITSDSHNGRAKSVITWDPRISKYELRRVAVFDCIRSTLSDGFSSRLMDKLRTRLGAVYNVPVSLILDDIEPLNSVFRVTVECEKSKAYEAIDIIIEEIIDMGKNGITEDEISKWRNRCESSKSALYECNSPDDLSDSIVTFASHSDIVPVPEQLVVIDSLVTSAEVQKEALAILKRVTIFSTLKI